MKKALPLMIIFSFALTLLLTSCVDSRQIGGKIESGSSSQVEVPSCSSAPPAEGSQDIEDEPVEENAEMKMNVGVGGSTFTATLENNAAVDALVGMMEDAPVTIRMRDYSGFEKVGELGQNLPVSNSQTTARIGDIVLYQGDQIVLFYGSNSWSYTRLGHIDDISGWKEALGGEDVTVTFSLNALSRDTAA